MLPAIIPIPVYKGSITNLDADHAPSPYFLETEICKWTLSHFLTSRNDESIFLDGLSTISRNKKIDVGVRVFTSSLRIYHDGPMGPLRRIVCRKVATNAIKRASVVQSHISAALSHEEALLEHENTNLGKHDHAVEDEDEADQHGRAKKITNHSSLLSKDDDSESLGEEDPVHMAQTLPHVPINAVFKMEDYEFTAKLDSVEFGDEFTAYYNDCRLCALSGVLFLEDRPTSLQKRYFSTKYEQLQDLVDKRVEHPTPEEVMNAVQVCRDAKDRKASLSRRGGVGAGRVAMEETVEKAPRSAL
ncbi:hypothetical protein BGZ65_005071 [Modicella reniformis]|uniref:Uncharacterized protein n=1 Tax=Modicella reniformis TaxID=1440133 RepID=A0A9P6LSR8_9FUNG|nr:hypothetical protein BGZ65_005071 [Modicella reniformis]